MTTDSPKPDSLPNDPTAPTEADAERAAPAPQTAQDKTRPDRTRKRTPPKKLEDGGAIVEGRYRVLQVLGRGGMGTVYLVEHIQIHKRFAMKVLPREETSDTRAARFEREAKATSKIGHENIVNVTDFGRTPSGDFFLVMELLEGKDLAHELADNGKLSVRRSIAITRQLCRALQAAHDKGIIHRDLKPANLFLVSPKRDFVKILDFGLAKVDEPLTKKGITREGTVMGTAQYMAPEQARGEPTDGRADIYALGCVLYEMLTGVAPFRAKTYNEALELQLTFHPSPPSAQVEEGRIPAALDAVVLRALHKHANERFQSMRDFEAALIAANSASTPGAALAPVEPARRTVRHVAMAIGGLLLLGATGLALDIHKLGKTPPVDSPAPERAPAISAPKAVPAVAAAPAPTPAPTPAPALHLTSQPADAVVTVDGVLIGATPIEVPLAADHAVRIDLDLEGYKRVQIRAPLDGPRQRAITLTPLPKRPKAKPAAGSTAAPPTSPSQPPPVPAIKPAREPTQSQRELKNVLE